MRIIHLRLEVEGKTSPLLMEEMLWVVVMATAKAVEDLLPRNIYGDLNVNLFYQMEEAEEECLEILN